MRRVRRLLVMLAVLALSGPAWAEDEGFGAAGTWWLGGATFASYHAEQGEWADEPYSEVVVVLAPSATWFFADRLALRLEPGLSFTFEGGPETPDTRSRWMHVELGPAAYLPLATDRLYLLAGVRGGVEKGTWRSERDPDLEFEGFRLSGEVGLALPTGTGGLVEVVATGTRRFLDRAHALAVNGYDVTDVLIGLRFLVAP